MTVKFYLAPGMRNRKFYLAPGMRNGKIYLAPNESFKKFYLAVKGLTRPEVGASEPLGVLAPYKSRLSIYLSIVTLIEIYNHDRVQH